MGMVAVAYPGNAITLLEIVPLKSISEFLPNFNQELETSSNLFLVAFLVRV